jgi:hypothetical protein
MSGERIAITKWEGRKRNLPIFAEVIFFNVELHVAKLCGK